MTQANTTSTLPSRWQRFSAAAIRAFHAYGAWLVSISWKRFVVLAILLLIVANIVEKFPPFSWTYTQTVTNPVPVAPPEPHEPAAIPGISKSGKFPGIHINTGPQNGKPGVDISIDENGVRIHEKPLATPDAPAAASEAAEAQAPVSAASAADEAAAASSPPVVEIDAAGKQVRIALPPGAGGEEVRQAIEEARQQVVEAIAEARADAAEAAAEAARSSHIEVRTVHLGDFLSDLAGLWIVASAILKFTYKGRIQAEVKAAQATETAEAESLKRQVVEARMAAMQAQVEPHFLFNTLASIDHLIETDPPRASQMQKNLIALLRASMPTMRETSDGGPRDLGRELAVVRPYVEILKVRMEERLDALIDVPDGLLSAEFPAMMIQTLVENSIRHGLEPKAEGGQLRVKAEIVHGKLAVTVADTGVGFGQAATSGTGVGLANIRERLQLLHGPQASLTVTANQPSGTVVTITVPYRTVSGTSFRAAA
jgi:signal transduction histidine kinase